MDQASAPQTVCLKNDRGYLDAASVRVDPAQPPMDSEWAQDWLKLAQVRLRGGRYDIAKAAAQVACDLDASLKASVERFLQIVHDEAEASKFKVVHVPTKETLTLELWHDSAENGLDLTGGVVWSGGEELARLLPLLGDLHGRRLVDLGSGTGVAGLAAALCGADVILTDLPLAIPLLERNVTRNFAKVQSCGGAATVRVLDWREMGNATDFGSCDLLLACDLVWRADQCEPLVRWIASFRVPCLFPLTPRTKKQAVQEALRSAWDTYGIQVRQLGTQMGGFDVVLLTAETQRSFDVSWLIDALTA